MALSRGKMTDSKHNRCHCEFHADVRLLGTNSVDSHDRMWPWVNPVLDKPPVSNSSILFEAFWGTTVDGDIC